RRDGTLRGGDELGGARVVVTAQRCDGGGAARGELGDVPEPLALVAQLVLATGREALGVCDEHRERLEPLARPGGVPGQLVVRATGGLQPAPRPARLRDGVAGPGKAVERRELGAGTAEPALLELAAHREERLGRGGDVLARGAPAPGVGACPAVG